MMSRSSHGHTHRLILITSAIAFGVVVLLMTVQTYDRTTHTPKQDMMQNPDTTTENMPTEGTGQTATDCEAAKQEYITGCGYRREDQDYVCRTIEADAIFADCIKGASTHSALSPDSMMNH